jgi:hypothetical protein
VHAVLTPLNVLPGAADGLGYGAVVIDRHLAGT